MHFFKTLYSAHLLVPLLTFVLLSATSPISDAADMHINNADGRSRITAYQVTRTSPQYVPNRSLTARDLYELPNGWVRIIWLIFAHRLPRSESQQMFGNRHSYLYEENLSCKSNICFEEDMLIPDWCRLVESTNTSLYYLYRSPHRFSKDFITL